MKTPLMTGPARQISDEGPFLSFSSMRAGQMVATYLHRGDREQFGEPGNLQIWERSTVDASGQERIHAGLVQEALRVYALSESTLVAPTVSPDDVLVKQAVVDGLLELMADLWVDMTQFSSSFDEIFTHPAVVQIVRLGENAIPLALARIDHEPERWSYVLHEITGLNPLTPETRREDAGDVWRAALPHAG